jgi:hypothetical protein
MVQLHESPEAEKWINDTWGKGTVISYHHLWHRMVMDQPVLPGDVLSYDEGIDYLVEVGLLSKEDCGGYRVLGTG